MLSFVVGINHHRCLCHLIMEFKILQYKLCYNLRKEDGNWLNWYMKKTNRSMGICDLLKKPLIYFTMKKLRSPPQRSSKSAVLYVQHMAASDQGFVWLLTPERCREGGCECVRLFGAGGQPNDNKGPALSLSPVIFQLSEKLLWHWKKVKLKSLAWYVLTTACCMCNTSKYFLSSHSCSFWKDNCPRVYNHWASCCFSMVWGRLTYT